MSWEQRGARRYYYRARRLEGRVVKEYVGGDADAADAAESDEQARVERLLQRQRRLRVEATIAELTRVVEPYWQLSERHSLIFLLANNYHRHRGEWRHRGRRSRKSQGETGVFTER